ncbi:MAG: lysoplasmalogenase, partial [Desulfobacteraceae bacterium]|nr:lysoplasmalogenase [Desulfobacteraceae bacterium]
MSRSQRILTLLAGISACIHLLSEYFGPQILIYVFKPLTMIFIISIAVIGISKNRSFYAFIILIGLLFSLAGDIFLMLPTNMFIQGLVSFLIGHIFYILAFSKSMRLNVKSFSWLSFLIYGLLISWYMLPSLKEMTVPVLIYIFIILAMGWRAYERWTQIRIRGAGLAFIGAILFIISDSALGINRFTLPFDLSALIVL